MEIICKPQSRLKSNTKVNIHDEIRGHVNNKKFQKSKKTLEVGGWVKWPIGNIKKLENIFLYIILLRF